jgi:hypothetical protein
MSSPGSSRDERHILVTADTESAEELPGTQLLCGGKEPFLYFPQDLPL